MSREYYDPWAKVAQSAQGAMFQYLNSRPDPTEQAIKQAQLNEYKLKNDAASRKMHAEDSIANSFKEIMAPGEAPRPSPEFEGPMPEIAPTPDMIKERYNERKSDLFANSFQSGTGPKGIAELYGAMAGKPVGGGGDGGQIGFIYDKVKGEHPDWSDTQILHAAQTGWRQGDNLGDDNKISPMDGYLDFAGNKKRAEASGKGSGELDVKRSENYTKAQSSLVGFKQKSEIVNQNIDKALNLIGNSSTATGYGSALTLGGILPGDRRELNNYLDTIKANVGFDQLQSMRESSPTGGALGQVSDMENRLLQAVSGALDPMMTDQLKENLGVIKQLYPQVLAEKQRAFDQDYGNSAPFGGNEVPPADAPSNIRLNNNMGGGQGKSSVTDVDPSLVPPEVQAQLKGPLMPATKVQRWGRDAHGNPVMLGG